MTKLLERSRVFLILFTWFALLLASQRAMGQVCPNPFAFSPSDITTNSVHLGWNSALDSFDLELKPFGEPAQYVIAHNTNYNWNGLAPSTKYQFRVRAVCNDGVSAWSNVQHFTTHLTNPSNCKLGLDISPYCFLPDYYSIDVEDVEGMTLGADVVLKEVKLLIKHDYLHDLKIRLYAPDGTSIMLMDRLGQEEANYGNPYDTTCSEVTILTDDQCAPLIVDFVASTNDSTNYVGFFRPMEALGLLNNTGINPNGTWRLEICDQHIDNNGSLEFFELVFASSDCLPPTNPSATDVGGDFIELSWEQSIAGDSVYIEYADFDFVPGSNNTSPQGSLVVVSGSLNHAVLPDLHTGTTYYVYLRSKCGSDFSENVCFVFETGCATPSIVTDFDDMDACTPKCNGFCSLSGIWQNLSQDDNDWIVRAGKTPSFSTGPKADVSLTGKYIFTETSGCSAGAKSVLQSNCLFVGNDVAENCAFSFYRHMKGGKMGELRLLVLDLSQNQWDTLWTLSGNQGKEWEQVFIDLADYEGQTIQLRFEGISGGASSDMALDELVIYGNIIDLGPANVFFRDLDDDGFGNSDDVTTSCGSTPPEGYVANSIDCDDASSIINPEASEILCNQIDENCNGLEDDKILPTPIVINNITFCASNDVTLEIEEPAIGNYYWFFNGVEVATGQSVLLDDIENGEIVSVLDSITDDNYTCKSDWTFTQVMIAPNPYLGPDTSIAYCNDVAFSSSSIELTDVGGEALVTTVYSQEPFVPENEIEDDFIASDFGTVYYQGTTSNGCTDVLRVVFNLEQPPLVEIEPTMDTLELCPNAIEVFEAVPQGIAPYTYEWSNGFTSNIALVQTASTPSTYSSLTVKVTDATGCFSSDTVTVRNNSTVTGVDIKYLQDVSACGGSDGEFTIFPQGGYPPYEIIWTGPTNGNGTTSDSLVIQGLTQGAYNIEIIDNSPAKCGVSFPSIVINSPGLIVSLDTVVDISCNGLSNGAIVFNVSGNNPTYHWSDNEDSKNRYDLESGLYSVTISDANCNFTFDDIKINEPDILQAVLSDKKDITCFGMADGMAEVNVFGGTQPYDYDWSAPTVQNGTSLVLLNKGAYECLVTDANGCIAPRLDFEIVEPDSMILNSVITYESCPGLSDGHIENVLEGGVLPYTYEWDVEALSGANANNLSNGFYHCQMSDANGCSVEAVYYIFDAVPIVIDTIMATAPECIGVADGQLTALASGGNGLLDYYWNSNSANAVFNNASSGLYSLRIKDANGCEVDSNFLLIAEQKIEISLDSIHSVSCHGMTDGYIKISASGGLSPYSYAWDNGSSLTELLSLAPNEYQVTITDSIGCQIELDSIMIVEPEALSLEAFVEDVHCFGESSGGIFAEALGGTKPYQFIWNAMDTTQYLVGVPIGDYELMVQDANNCQRIITKTIDQPDSIIINVNRIDMAANCITPSKGAINIQVTGGVQPYDYQWNNGDTTKNISGLNAGSYKLVVTDQNSCVTELKSVSIYQTDLDFEILAKKVSDISCFGSGDGELIIEGFGGTPPYNYNWSNGSSTSDQWLDTPFDTLSNLEKGVYFLTITDNKGCIKVSDSLMILEPDLLHVNLDSIYHNPCSNTPSQIFTTSKGGVSPYHYLWNNLSFEDDPDSLIAGVYSVHVSDDNDCVATLPQPIELIEYIDDVSIQIDSIIPQNCQNLGKIYLTIEGDFINPSFIWSNGSTAEDAEDLLPGYYAVEVTDTTGCKLYLDSIDVPLLPNEMDLELTSIDNVSCFGESDGSISVEVISGEAPFEYYWSSGSSDSLTLGNLSIGVYGVTIVDANSCVAISSGYSVGQPDELKLDNIIITDAINQENGQIELSMSGGISPYAFSWSTGQGGNPLTGLSSGSYGVTVTDFNGCQVLVSSLMVDNVVGTQNPSQTPIIIYPNPASSNVFIKWKTHKIQDLTIISAIGESYQPPISWGVDELEIDISELPSGVYYLQLVQKDGLVRNGLLRVVRF